MKKICKPFTYFISMVQVLLDKKWESSLGYNFSYIFSPIPHTNILPAKNPSMEVEKNDCRYPVPTQPFTEHSHIPLVHKRSAREVAAF